MRFVLPCLAALLALSAPAFGGTLLTTGLYARFAADSGVTTSGGAVTSWTDSVGGFTVSQGTSTRQPTLATGVTGGLPAVRFDGGDRLVGTLGAGKTFGDATIFVLAASTTATPSNDYYYTLGTGSSGDVMSLTRVSDGKLKHWHGGFSYITNVSHTTTNSFQVFAQEYDDDTAIESTAFHNLRVDGSDLSNADWNSPPGSTAYGANSSLTIGDFSTSASNFMTGDMVEMLIYDRRLTLAEIEQVELYLEDRRDGLSSVPEPSTAGLLGAVGALAVSARRLRKRGA